MSLHARPREDLPAETREGTRSAPREDLELPRPWRLIFTAGWNLAESLGLPAAAYLVGAALGGQAAGMVAATGVVWLAVAVRKVVDAQRPRPAGDLSPGAYAADGPGHRHREHAGVPASVPGGQPGPVHFVRADRAYAQAAGGSAGHRGGGVAPATFP